MGANQVDQNQLSIETMPPQVTISEDRLEATVVLPRLPEGVKPIKYSARDIMDALTASGVTYGINQEQILEIVDVPSYGYPFVVARGLAPVEGIAGEYTYHFDTEVNPEPKVNPDGSVDYKSMKTIETVAAGDVIATYTPAVPGKIGYDVLGNEIPPTLVRDLPPIPGRGFDRSEDGLTYTANTTGKIEMKDKRIIISPVYEIKARVGVETGNIDFAGDVIIHGTVSNGVSVKATGNITIDGLVETCFIHANKDIFLLAGVKGNEATEIRAKGNITAQFIEMATVFCGGDIEADVFYDSNISCNGAIRMTGKKSSILGGDTAAVEGIEVSTMGNEFGVITKAFVGTTPSRAREKAELEAKYRELDVSLHKITDGLEKFEALAKENGISYREDPRRVQLLRVKIQQQAQLDEARMKIDELNDIITRGRHASIKVNKTVYVGTEVCISDHRLRVKETENDIEFVRTEEGVRMQHMKG